MYINRLAPPLSKKKKGLALPYITEPLFTINYKIKTYLKVICSGHMQYKHCIKNHSVFKLKLDQSGTGSVTDSSELHNRCDSDGSPIEPVTEKTHGKLN
jgi:hypothetical protein